MLGTWERCGACGEYGFSRMHCCKPLWFARRAEDTDDEFEQIRATSAEAAAETFAHKMGQWAEYGRVETSQVILVRPFGDDTRSAFAVYGEVQPVYTARQIPLPESAIEAREPASNPASADFNADRERDPFTDETPI